MKKLISILAWILFTGKLYSQQEVQFSQYVFNGLAINPAYAGYKSDWYVQGVFRQQWIGFPGAPRSAGISFDGLTGAQDSTVGIGGQILMERLGPQQSISLFGNYNYRIRLNEDNNRRLCLGIAFGATQYSLDGRMLDPIDANDPNISYGMVSTWVPDAKFGIYYYTPNWYMGISVLNLFAVNRDRKIYYSSGHEYVTIQKTAHVYFTIGKLIPLSDNVKLKPSFLWKEDFHGPSSLDLNLFALLSNRVWIGGSYRTSMKLWKTNLQDGLTVRSAASGMVEYYANRNFRIGYSLDIATNGLAGYEGGTHELSLGITIAKKEKNVSAASPRYF